MTSTIDFETLIIEKLEDDNQTGAVIDKGTPNSINDYNLNEEKGCILVYYGGSPNVAVQERRTEQGVLIRRQSSESKVITILVGYVSLRQPGASIYDTADYCKRTLHNLDIKNHDPLRLFNISEPKYNKGKNIWWLTLKFMTIENMDIGIH